VDRLRQDATEAAQVRAYQTHPDVVALRTEKVRTQVDGMIWAGLLLGLAFTMVNVQTFAAAGAALFSLGWCAAWLLDPMVSLVLVAVLRAEQITARYQVGMGGWVTVTKLFAFAATYVMNTWQSWAALNLAGIVLHSVPPVLVYCAAEAGPVLRDRLTEAVLRAAQLANPATAEPADAVPANTPANTGTEAVEQATEPVQIEAPAPKPARRPATRRKTSKKPQPGGESCWPTTWPKPALPTCPAPRSPRRGCGASRTARGAPASSQRPDLTRE
jgi:hypothetical protein